LSTNCMFPPELDDKQLLTYLDDPEANRETALHLEKCSYCREKAAALDRLQKRMTSRLYRITCPSPVELGEYHLRMLPSSQMLIVSQHLRECPYCTREVDQLKEFLSDLATNSGSNLFQNTKVLVARLVGERDGSSVIGEPSFALRGEGEGPITFVVEGIVIVLDVQTAGEDKVNILGQVAADNQDLWIGSKVTLKQVDESKITDSLDDLGAFNFKQVISGSIQITFLSPQGVELRIPTIDV